jgi:hypothetical protein
MFQAPVYEEPIYQEPVYQEPAYTPPIYQEPVYTPPVYQEPVYTPAVEPVTQEPVYQPSMYDPPVYQEPVYTPAVEPVTQEVAPVEQPYFDPYQYIPPVDPYVEPYVAPAAEPVAQEPAPVEQPYAPVATPYTDPYQYTPAATPYTDPYQYTPSGNNTAMDNTSFGDSNLGDLSFGDFSIGGIGGPMMGAEIVGSNLANTMLGGPELGGSYTGGMGGGPSRTEEERQAAILVGNPYVRPTEDMSLEPVTNGDRTGYYFTNELGLPARYGEVGLPQPADPATFDPNAKYTQDKPGFVPVDPNATYRLVSGGTDGDVVYSGAGEEGLRNVFQQANQLTLDNGKNAYWGVEILDPVTGQYKRVAENQGPNGLGIVGDIAGIALPIAAAIATGGASLGVQIAAGAAAGGLGGFLSGNDPLKSALIAGATAGIGNVSGFNKAVGGALSNVGDAVKNTLIPQAATQAVGGLSDDIVVNALSSLAKGVGGGALQGAAAGVTGSGSPAQPAPTQPAPTEPPAYEPINSGAVEPIVVTGGGSTTGLEGLTGLGGGVAASLPALGGLASDPFLSQPAPVTEPTPADDTIVVSADRAPQPVSGSGSAFAAAVPIPVEAILNGTIPQPTPEPVTEEQYADEPIVVEAYRPLNPVGGFDPTAVSQDLSGLGGSVLSALPALGNLPMDPVLNPPAEPQAVTPDTGLIGTAAGGLSALTNLPADPALNPPDPAVEDIVVNANKPVPQTVVPPIDIPVAPILPQLGIPQVPTPDPALTNPKKPLGVEEYLRIAGLLSGLVGNVFGGDSAKAGQAGTYTPGGRGLNPIFSAKLPTSSGFGVAGMNRTARPMGDVDWLTYGTRPELSFFDYAMRGVPAPITKPIPNNPAGPAMYLPDTTRFAEGGTARGGQPLRTEFAVNGAGTGRSDDIPAVLSDGEYVIDAETVALLGDGSNKAGAKKLDELRVKVRKHKGQKLAKGRFSANAKKAEAYLSGGRV